MQFNRKRFFNTFHLESNNPSLEDARHYLNSKVDDTFKIATEKGVAEYTKADLIWSLKNGHIKKADVETPHVYISDDDLKLIKNYNPARYPGDIQK
jgi:hypothetical protein